MKELKVGPKDEDLVLIAKYQGKLYCTGNKCPHFGAPLTTGVLFEDKVICPWHSASFSIKSGRLEGAPSLDGLPRYEVYSKDGKHFVKLPENYNKAATASMAKRDPKNKSRFVIIGGGSAGLTCAETLRQSDYTGEIVVISAEDILPYDRTLLTKALPDIDARKLLMRPEEFIKSADIDYRLGTRVEKVDTKGKHIHLSNGEKLVRIYYYKHVFIEL
jgi:nitrite reductase/ring-hydroxylating ferredoxin subunit